MNVNEEAMEMLERRSAGEPSWLSAFFGVNGRALVIGALGGFALIATGCATKQAAMQEDTIETTTAPAQEEEKVEETVVEAPAPAAETTREAEPPAPLNFPVVRFEFDSDVITPEGRAALDEFASQWRTRGIVGRLVIEGHTDERGPEEYNLLLGQKRANSVRTYLSRLGLPDRALKAVSYGENRPIDLDSSEAAHARNRRAEVVQEN